MIGVCLNVVSLFLQWEKKCCNPNRIIDCLIYNNNNNNNIKHEMTKKNEQLQYILENWIQYNEKVNGKFSILDSCVVVDSHSIYIQENENLKWRWWYTLAYYYYWLWCWWWWQAKKIFFFSLKKELNNNISMFFKTFFRLKQTCVCVTWIQQSNSVSLCLKRLFGFSKLMVSF